MSAATEYRYNRLTWAEMNDAIAMQKVVILPTGSTEQHGRHLPIDVDAVIVPLDPAQAGSVEQRAREAVETFLHPLRGGPEGRGWDLGRDVFLSDIAAVLERVAGIDYVKELSLLINSESQGERIKVADDKVVVAGQIRLSLIQE